VSTGRNRKTSNETNKSANQTTNYGDGDALGVSVTKGDVQLESLDDDVATAAIDASNRATKLALNANSQISNKAIDTTRKNFSELIGYAERENKRDDQTLRGALESVQTIAEDKATGVQQAQRMTVFAVGGVLLAGIVFSPKKKAN